MRGRWADHPKCLWSRIALQGARKVHAVLVMITLATGGQTLCPLEPWVTECLPHKYRRSDVVDT